MTSIALSNQHPSALGGLILELVMSALAEAITSSDGQWSLFNFQNTDFWLKRLLMSSKEANESSLARSQNLQRIPQSQPLSYTTWYCYRSYQGLNLYFPLDYGKFTRVALLQTEQTVFLNITSKKPSRDICLIPSWPGYTTHRDTS